MKIATNGVISSLCVMLTVGSFGRARATAQNEQSASHGLEQTAPSKNVCAASGCSN